MPFLGDIVAYTITTPDLDRSLHFYESVGFSEVMRAEWPFPWIQVSDGVVLIMLRKDSVPYMALTYYVKDINKVVKALEKDGIKFLQKPGPKDQLKRYVLQSPDGGLISLVNVTDGFRQPGGRGMMQLVPHEYNDPANYHNRAIGMFGEYAQPVADLGASVAFWKKLGFEVMSEFASPYPWAILSDGVCVIGLHQTDHFSKPALTYFAGDMADRVASLVAHGLVPISGQGAGNAVFTTPEGQLLFLYSLGGGTGTEKPKETERLVIETERLLLKAVTPALMRSVLSTMSDDDAIAFLGLTGPDELNSERKKLAGGLETYRNTFLQFVLQVKATGRNIGRGGFHNWAVQHARAEVGYLITDVSQRNMGYMKEAMAAIVNYGFTELMLNRVEALIGPDNEPSLRLAKGLGFVEEGRLRSHYFVDGVYHDSLMFGLLRSEYFEGK